MDEKRFSAKGVVQTSYSCLGMGIEFTEMSLNDRGVLSDILLMLSRSTNGKPVPEMLQSLFGACQSDPLTGSSVRYVVARIWQNLGNGIFN